jgi:ABC-type multidrug transport system fused ATPase/permease subunit
VKLTILLIVANRSFSKQSSASGDDFDENDDDDEETTSDDPSKKTKKHSHTPFAFKILKLNAPEWPWILLGSICSLVYGASQPLFALFFAQIYSLFAEPDLEKQKHLTSVYAGAIFLVGLASGVTQFLSSAGFGKSGEELTMRMRQLTFSAMLRQEIGYFDHESNSVGALVTRLSSDASALKVKISSLKFL